MANDREVLREIWEGRIPICFQLNPDEVCGLRGPDPYYLIVPRLSYFPLVTDKVRKQFTRHIQPDKSDGEMWLDFNGQAIKWHYPIGVLFDLLADESSLPWTLTVHFTRYPEKELLHCQCREVVESHFMSCMKEADILKHRSPIFSTMQRKDHTQLWLGLQNDKFDQFWAVNRKLMEGEDAFKYIPFRWYRGDEPFCQRLVRPLGEDGQLKTFKDLVQEMAPDIDSSRDLTLLVHGISPPLETPLQWMSEHLSYPDNFLHIVCLS